MAVNVLTEAEGLSVLVSTKISVCGPGKNLFLCRMNDAAKFIDVILVLDRQRLLSRDRRVWAGRAQDHRRPVIRGILYALPPSLALGLLPYCLIYARIIASNYRIARGHG